MTNIKVGDWFIHKETPINEAEWVWQLVEMGEVCKYITKGIKSDYWNHGPREIAYSELGEYQILDNETRAKLL